MPYYPPASSGSGLPTTGGTMTGTITSTIGTITANTPALSATQEWNASGVTFQGIFLNVTATAQASGSRLVDIQVGGSSKFAVDASGTAIFRSDVQISPNRLAISKDNPIAWTVGAGNFGSVDTGLSRNAAGVVEVNNGTQFSRRDLRARTLIADASTTSQASLRLAHGTAPTSPVDGDMWTTTAGLFVRINGSTIGPLT